MIAKVAVSACIISKSTKKILLARRMNPPGAGLLCLPGGKVNQGEVTRDAVLREIEEEVGLKASDLRLSQPFHVTDVLIKPKDTGALTNTGNIMVGRNDSKSDDSQGFNYFIVQYVMVVDHELSYLRAGDDVDMIQWIDPVKDLGILPISFEDALKDRAGDIEGITDLSQREESWRNIEHLEDVMNVENALDLEYFTKTRAEELRTLTMFDAMKDDHLVGLRSDLPVMRSIIPVISKALDLYKLNRLYFEQP